MVIEPVKKRKKILRWIGAGILIFISASVLAGIYLLKSGISVEQLDLGQATITDSSLIWNDKLELHLGTVSILSREQGEENSDVQGIVDRSFRAAGFLSRLFSRISIESLKIEDQEFNIDLSQDSGHSYLLNLKREATTLDGIITIEPETVQLVIRDLSDERIGLAASGRVRLGKGDKVVSGSIIADIENSFPIELNFEADDRKVSFWGAEAGVITDIRPFVDLFDMAPNTTKWFTDYLIASRYHLLQLRGEYVYGDPMSLFHSFEAEIKVDDVAYTFEPDLEAIYDDRPGASFKNGILDIRPTNPVFYGHDVGSSWVEINFNDFDNFILTAHIKTGAIVDQPLIDLLSYYSIEIPFLQVEGETEADFQLIINIITDEISGFGSFSIDNGVIFYDGIEFNVRDVRFSVRDSEVLLEQLEVRYEKFFTAHVTGQIFADRDVWDLDINLEHLDFDIGESRLSLDVSDTIPDVSYHASPEGHFLEAGDSSWFLDSMPITIGSFRAPVELDDLSAQISSVSLAMPSSILAEVSGYFSIKKGSIHLDCDLLKYQVNNLKLEQPKTPITVKYTDKLIISAAESSEWSLSNVPLTLYPSEVMYGGNNLTIASGSLSYGNLLMSNFTGDFDMLTSEGVLYLTHLNIIHEYLDTRINVGDRTIVEISEKDGVFDVNFEEFGVRITADDQQSWSVKFDDLTRLYDRSLLLRDYNIRSGHGAISSVNGKMPYRFTADIESPYLLLMEDEVMSDRLVINGNVSEDGVSAVVNNNLSVNYHDDQLDIRSQGVGFNIAGVRELIDDLFEQPGEEQDEAQGVKLNLYAEDSYLYLNPQSKILADSIQLVNRDNELLMDLSHGAGLLQVRRIGEINFINGEKLNDEFMGALAEGSYVQGGTLALAGMGSYDDFSVVITLDDTVIKDLKTLNNTMTLLNTLPALVTFSVPEYETKGLPVRSAIVGIKYSDNKTVFKSIDVASPVLQAAGTGWIDMSTRQIDMDIQLTSEAGKNMRKIPIVGYVVAGKSEDTSVTLKIKGDLDNPEVSNSVLKEIVTMPVDMLFRVLNLPIHLLQKMETYFEEGDWSPPLDTDAEFPEGDR